MALAPQIDTGLIREAGKLVLNLYEVTNQTPLSPEQSQVRAGFWASALIEAGIPPSKWDAMATLARRARPSASKAFVITVDQMIDAWDHYLVGDRWNVQEQAWRAYRPPIVYCGKCEQGEIPVEVTEEVHGQPRSRTVYKTCPCKIEYSARNCYHFRRFSDAYELRYGTPYEASESDLASLYKVKDEVDNLSWDSLVEERFSASLKIRL
jgi:hypothetical protein